jgi:tRNA U34 5-methylaminomethyl-2-thiouridine-forming methyltransferase MnmC
MNHELTIVKTADGSNTIFNSKVGENYHSRNGALQESKHVFVKSGLEYFLSANPQQKSISILEVGFGTGLNFLLSADFCSDNNININYTGVEAYPLSLEMVSATEYNEYVSAATWKSFIKHYSASLQQPVSINANCQLNVADTKLIDFTSTQQYDVIYFDAFASAHQPEMWNQEAIAHTLSFLKPGGVFVTYAITGNLKRIIKGLGLKVEKAPGAPGKREMLRACR